MMNSNNVIIKPVISEKSLKDAGSGRYTFVVAKDADKKDIKEAVERLFEVNVKKVFTTLIKKTKTRVTRYRRKTKQHFYKKARVIIGKDQKINIFEESVK